ncbi:MAG: hypothetical protein KF805_14545 [Phycisphaeraceae bacterium]|nr:hypothetical protein [Phycisphaeraceae bacterium]
MATLTKVLVIIAAVLSLFLSALVIAYSFNTDRILQDRDAEVARSLAAQGQLADNATQASAAKASWEKERAALETQLTDRDARSRELERVNAELTRAKAKAEQDLQAITLKIAELGETVNTQATLITGYRAEVTALRGNELRFREQAVQSDDRISDLESQNEVLSQSVRALREQLEEARLTREGGMASMGMFGAVSAKEPFVDTGIPVTGSIENVTTDPSTGATLVKINLGSNDRIRENQKLFISRGKDFVANLVIVKTDMRFAIGRVDTLSRDVQVQSGDSVTTRLQ